jgi:hypothetical protein
MQNSIVRTMVAVAACMFIGASAASAQVTRTWVSGVGNDADPCSRTAPCRTFAGALANTAAGGEISVLDPGGYGTVNITKAITISGVGENASILSVATHGVIVNTPAGAFVTLKNIMINGAGSGLVGIRLLSASNLVVDNVHVMGFDTGLEANQGLTVVNHSNFTNNSLTGVQAKGGHVSIEHGVIVGNGTGVVATSGIIRLNDVGIYNNATSIGCGGGTIASASNNRLAGNAGGPAPCAPTVAITIQ